MREDIRDQYFYELGRCKHYELKCRKYRSVNNEKYVKYLPKYYRHKALAARYYSMLKGSAGYSDFMEDESLFADSRYFTES